MITPQKLLALLLITATLGNVSGCGFCLFGACFVDEMEVEQRDIDTTQNTFTIAGKVDGEFNSHTFKMAPLQTVEKLSFGFWDADIHRIYSAVKKIHILSDSALDTYRTQYLNPGKDCPSSFMNQNLQNLLLLPANDAIAKQLENYDIPFDGRGTPFKLTGYPLIPDHSYFIKRGEKINLTIPTFEAIASNLGSAQHKINYFLVTEIGY